MTSTRKSTVVPVAAAVVIVIIVIAGISWLWLLYAPGTQGDAGIKQIAVISIPDIHSAVLPHVNKNGTIVGGLARSKEVVREIRKNYDGSLLLSAGDDLGNDENGMYFRLFRGVPERNAMSAMGFDAGTIGNHDFDEGSAAFAEALGVTSFPIVAANIRFDNKSVQDKVQPYIIRDVAGTRIGIFGLSYPDTEEYATDLKGITIDKNVSAIAADMVKELRSQKADLVIALTHLGKKKDRDLAESVSGIDLIIGGHDHIYYWDTATSPSGKKTIMTDGGVYGDSVSVLSFRYNGTGIDQPKWTVIPVDGLQGTNTTISRILDPYTEQYRSWSDTIAGTIDIPLDARNFDPATGESETGTFVTTAMRQYGEGSDIALCPTGSLSRSAVYLKGSVTRGELGLLIDHNNRLSFIRMPGRDIVKALETGVSFLKPVNRNGTLILTTVSPLVLQSSGIAMQVNLSREGGNRLSNVRVLNGTKYEPIDPDREYRVIVNTRIGQFDEGYKIFQNEPAENVNNTDIRILDTVMNYMADRNPGQNPAPALTATA